MKKLKKYSIFILILIGLTACSKEKIELSKSKELESIKVTEVIKEKKEERDIVNIDKEEDINNFIDSVSSATKTKQSSISDTPTNVDKYFIISLNHKDSKNNDSKFYELREQFNSSKNLHERSALFIYLNRHAFNGLCRYNSKGAFNVPFGRYKSPYFPQQEMEGFIQKSDRVELMCGDFQTTLSLADNTDTVYCDPPYAPLSPTASFTTYAKEGFNLDDQIRLSQSAQQIAPNSQGVLISNHDTEFTRDIYSENS